MQRREDRLKDRVGVREEFVIPEADDSEAKIRQLLASLLVVPTMSLFGVLSPIEFDDQPCLDADEVDNEVADRLLPPEFPSREPSST